MNIVLLTAHIAIVTAFNILVDINTNISIYGSVSFKGKFLETNFKLIKGKQINKKKQTNQKPTTHTRTHTTHTHAHTHTHTHKKII